jgi:hypothetical protein
LSSAYVTSLCMARCRAARQDCAEAHEKLLRLPLKVGASRNEPRAPAAVLC